ncbi:MAG: hypothetical protein AAGD86_01120 [Pseudomonadota bacterium]
MNQIEQIKDLLFGHEKKALDAITRRLDTPESRAADVADVLPQSLRRSHARDGALTEAMQAPVTASIRLAVRQHPKAVADSLFPIIGPAIRKAVAEALKGLVQSINQTLDTRLSPRMRFRAWRAGVPLPQYIVQRSLVYQVEQVFLIHRETGLLLRHASDVPAARDEDAVSAMFTAIQDFVKESFADDGSVALETADMGEYTLWAVHGPAAMLTCLIRGTPPRALRIALTEILEDIHRHHSELLLDFNGESAGTEVLQPDIERCLQMEKGPEEEQRSAVPGVALWIVLVALAGAACYAAANAWIDHRDAQRFRAVLAATPGIVPLAFEADGDVIIARGMRDPLADMPLADAVESGRLRLAMLPFHSLEPQIVERRARAALAPPDGVSLSLEATTLVVSGAPDTAFRQRVQNLAPMLAGIDAVAFRQVALSDEAILRAVIAAVGQPDAVRLSVQGGVLSVTGSAPAAWRGSLETRLAPVSGLVAVRTDALKTLEAERLRALADEIAGLPLYFGTDAQFSAGQEPVIDTLANRIDAFIQTALAVDLSPAVSLTGFTDGSGESGFNASLRRDRAAAAREALVALGVAPRFIDVGVGPPAPVDSGIEAGRRRVSATATARDAAGREWTDATQVP